MKKENIKGKKLLILGGNYSTCEVVRLAKQMGLYTLVVSNSEEGEAKDLADEKVLMDVADTDSIVDFIKSRNIDGVMTGASEFHILNMIKICKKAGLPCYATEEQWCECQNKYTFKELCRKYNVPHVPFYSNPEDVPENLYPVILKPVDGCSARGITVCNNKEALYAAIPKAKEYSNSGKVIIEKFVQNKGKTHSVRYLISNGKLYCEAVGDRYVLDPKGGKALITASAFYPSPMTDYYLKFVDEKVKKMFESIGLKNGALFMEAISDDENRFMFYEMGLRISGGMTYKITEITNDVNELKMLIRFAVSNHMFEGKDELKISPKLNNYATASITFPLTTGTIGSIGGIDEIKKIPEVNAIIKYYGIGDEISEKQMGSLDQLFCRISIIAKGKERLIEIIDSIKKTISVKDINGKEMLIKEKLTEIIEDYKDGKE